MLRRSLRHQLWVALALLFTLVATGCGLLPEVQDETKGWSAQKLYDSAKESMGDGDYTKAIKYFETLEARYPYGRYAQQAQLEIAYAYFKDDEPASAISAADRFIKLHPNHPNVDYAYYLKGLVNFNEDTGFLSRLSDQDMSERDPKASKEAFESFKELVTRFPESKYSADAAARMKYLVNALAAHEVHVARYYIKRKAFVAAANRAQAAVIDYPQAPAREEALAIMARAYAELGMNGLRDDAVRVLKLNFPNSQYLAGNYIAPERKAWWEFW
jgi:outer membrane protein assembly factor BamD